MFLGDFPCYSCVFDSKELLKGSWLILSICVANAFLACGKWICNQFVLYKMLEYMMADGFGELLLLQPWYTNIIYITSICHGHLLIVHFNSIARISIFRIPRMAFISIAAAAARTNKQTKKIFAYVCLFVFI